jgi:aminoglycoside 6'-N-acetyltransferase
MLGLNKGEVKLVPHAAGWAVDFIQEKELLSEAIGLHIVDIEHMGSTAINGIAAKPLLDILVGVRSMGDVAKFDKKKLKDAGYYHLGRVDIKGKIVFAKFINLEELTKTHVLHIVEYGGDWWQKHTFFRDYLNEHPYVAKRYETLKKELAATYPDNESSYTEGKLKFVDEILSQRGTEKFIINEGNLLVSKLESVDKVLLSKWLSDPEILQYYEGRDNPFNIEKVEQEFFSDDEENITRCLVEFSGIPIGYVQFYIVDEKVKQAYGYGGLPKVIYGMDQFIGETVYWNKGIGTQLVRAIVAYLIGEKGADRIVMDPQTWNERAIRSYEKCGFEKVKLLPANELHEGEYRDCWLVEYNRKDEAGTQP